MAVKNKVHRPPLTSVVKVKIQEHFATVTESPKTAIDATCGNGHDTVFLANLVSDQVFAFDVQQQALEQTQHKLEEANLQDKVELIHSGHEQLKKFVTVQVDVIMFNLGYLPSSDKTITTNTMTTLPALDAATELLTANGIMTVLCYPGHTEGFVETQAVKEWLQQQSEISIETIESHHASDTSPVLFLLKKC